jgi:uncharacterized membrane protein
MKSSLLIATLGLCLTSAVWLKADDTDSSSSTPATPPPEGQHHWGPQLSADDKAKLKAAYESAIQSNPDLKTEGEQLRQQEEAYHKKLNDAMIAADSSVAPLLEKMHHHHGPPPGEGGGQ